MLRLLCVTLLSFLVFITCDPCNPLIASIIKQAIIAKAAAAGFAIPNIQCIAQHTDGTYDFEALGLVLRINPTTSQADIISGDPGEAYGLLNTTDISVVNVTAFNQFTNDATAIRVSFADALPHNSSNAGLTIGWNTQYTYNNTVSQILFDSVNPPITTYNGTSTTYDAAGGVSFHYVTINNLNHSALYYYSIIQQGNSTSNTTDIYNVTTSQLAGDATEFSFIHMADMGLDEGSGTHTGLIQQLINYSFIAHVGDISYADDYFVTATLSNDTYESIYNKWQSYVQPISSVRPYMVGVGNHEASCQEVLPTICPPSQQYFNTYNNRYMMPSKQSNATAHNMWYSINYGLLHLVFINSETDYLNSPEGPNSTFHTPDFSNTTQGEQTQYQWLLNDLSAVNRTLTPWLIVTSHRPMYSSATDNRSLTNYTYSIDLINAFEPVLQKYSVDLFLSGHVHW